MIYLKTYEGFSLRFRKDKSEPQVGDYVLCDSNTDSLDIEENKEFVENNIGQISRILKKKICSEAPYIVKYDIPEDEEDLKNDFGIYVKGDKEITKDVHRFSREEILHYGTKEEMEAILTAKKYNL